MTENMFLLDNEYVEMGKCSLQKKLLFLLSGGLKVQVGENCP